ncbi:MAG: putative lipid II flippase FtsW [Gammaproteobacteria bacterium]|nr:putative lipid II flippase FtsW [Gammaproteobacteria bacterium]
MRQRRQASSKLNEYNSYNNFQKYDLYLISLSLFLVGLGLIMVASASVSVADRNYLDPLHYFWRQGIAAIIGLTMSFIIIHTPLVIWQQGSVAILMVGIFLLVLVLIPGIGREVNGSMRWISIGPFNLQSSEPVKLCVIAYLAGYLVRHRDKVMNSFAGFIRPIGVVTLVAGLLLLEPDYGSAVVLFGTALGMLFMGGVPLSRFLLWVCAASTMLVSLAVFSPYRLKRLTSFIDPWQDPFNSGFQLTQALIAFGRGDWLGVGLGNSVQKLFYLPEAHTDFVFSVFAEEFGLVGSIVLILAFLFLVWRAFVIAKVAEQSGRDFAAYVAYGIGTLIGIQAFINIGVNMGVLPTKGLTLPLISYGGNSMIVSCMLIALLVRVELENHQSPKDMIPESQPSYVA